jgi:hypothetical protein
MAQRPATRLLAVVPLLAAISSTAPAHVAAQPHHVVSVMANDPPPIIRGEATGRVLDGVFTASLAPTTAQPAANRDTGNTATDQIVPTGGFNAFTFNRRVEAGPDLSDFIKIGPSGTVFPTV